MTIKEIFDLKKRIKLYESTAMIIPEDDQAAIFFYKELAMAVRFEYFRRLGVYDIEIGVEHNCPEYDKLKKELEA